MASKDAITCDYLPVGLRTGYMSDSLHGVRRWHPSGTVVAIPDGPGRLRLAADIDIEVDGPRMQDVLANYKRLPVR